MGKICNHRRIVTKLFLCIVVCVSLFAAGCDSQYAVVAVEADGVDVYGDWEGQWRFAV